MKKTPLFGLLAVGVMPLLSGGCAADQIVAAPSPALEPSVTRVLEGAAPPVPAGAVITFRCVDRIVGPPPLFVVDGRVIDQTALSSDIDPDRIVSIEIMKGRSALDSYGEAGKNGVVVITTRRGAGTR